MDKSPRPHTLRRTWVVTGCSGHASLILDRQDEPKQCSGYFFIFFCHFITKCNTKVVTVLPNMAAYAVVTCQYFFFLLSLDVPTWHHFFVWIIGPPNVNSINFIQSIPYFKSLSFQILYAVLVSLFSPLGLYGIRWKIMSLETCLLLLCLSTYIFIRVFMKFLFILCKIEEFTRENVGACCIAIWEFSFRQCFVIVTWNMGQYDKDEWCRLSYELWILQMIRNLPSRACKG